MSADPLLALIRAVPMRCADCGDTTTTTRECPDGDIAGMHTFVTDDAAIVRAVRAWLRSVEPPRSEVFGEVSIVLGRLGAQRSGADPDDNLLHHELADAVRALYRRAWEVKP